MDAPPPLLVQVLLDFEEVGRRWRRDRMTWDAWAAIRLDRDRERKRDHERAKYRLSRQHREHVKAQVRERQQAERSATLGAFDRPCEMCRDQIVPAPVRGRASKDRRFCSTACRQRAWRTARARRVA